VHSTLYFDRRRSTVRTHISPDTVVWVCRERLSSRANEATIGDGGRSIVMPLYDFERDNQLQLIASHLQHYGRLTGPRKEGAFGEIFTFERDGYPRHIIAKCPKIEKFGSDARAREALGKTVIELEKTLSYYRHPGVHRISGLELVHGWPFLMSRLRKGTLADLIADPTQWTLTSKLMSLVQIARTLNYCQRVGLIAHQDLKPDNIFFDLPKEKYAIEADNYVGMVHEIYVADFGIADAFRDIGKNSGSYPYMAPEQHNKGLLEDGSKIDVFALAVIAFECLSDGLHPIGERTSDVWPIRLSEKPRKWGHEEVWKTWARRKKTINFEGAADHTPIVVRDLISRSLSTEHQRRPSMSDFEETLWDALRTVDADSAAGLRMQLDYLEGLASNPESGWPYMEARLHELREFYAQWGLE
jgi:serine/threonine protein kinase